MQLGNRTNLGEAQKRGAESNVIAKREKALEILRVLNGTGLLTGGSAADVAAALNQHGVVTRQGLSWSRTNVRAPLKEAQQIAREELNAAMKSNPNFGRFA